MDRQTITQYGVTLVAAVTCAIIMLFATPFGETLMYSITRMAENQSDKVDEMMSDEQLEKEYDDMLELFDATGLLQPGTYESGGVTPIVSGNNMISEKYLVITKEGLAYADENTKNLVGDYVMHKEIKEVATNTFVNCSGLTLVRLSENTVKLGASSFQNCTKLKTFISGKSLETIDDSAFSGCSSLRLVYLNKGLKSISSNAFRNCPELTMIKFRGTIDEWNSISKASNWHNGTISKIICYDGTIPA
jgi:hypothetical protein